MSNNSNIACCPEQTVLPMLLSDMRRDNAGTLRKDSKALAAVSVPTAPWKEGRQEKILTRTADE
jgi:hypothetical protein